MCLPQSVTLTAPHTACTATFRVPLLLRHLPWGHCLSSLQGSVPPPFCPLCPCMLPGERHSFSLPKYPGDSWSPLPAQLVCCVPDQLFPGCLSLEDDSNPSLQQLPCLIISVNTTSPCPHSTLEFYFHYAQIYYQDELHSSSTR